MKTHLNPSAIFVLRLKVITWLVFLAINAGYSQSQVTGKITGKDGIALSGATVAVVGTTNVTITDADGKFALAASPGALLEFSYIGYDTFQMVLRDETELNIPLSEGTVVLNEIVVVGYGTSKRKDITGAVASVSNDDFISGNITNPLQQIQGKVPGVVITQPGGDPNGDPIVRIRGATSAEGQPPLVVIDGVAIDDFNRAITTLNPADIATYDILKDASAAAIYGTRGANGVILITTKRAKSGQVSIEYHGFTGVEMVSNQFHVLDTAQWRSASYARARMAIDTVAAKNAVAQLDSGANTDWQKAITQTAYSQSHTVAISSGTDRLSFRGSVGYIKQDGVVINSGKEILTARLGVTQKSLENRLEINFNFNASIINRNFLFNQFSTGLARNGGSGVFGLAATYLPVSPVYDSLGQYYIQPNSPPNPVYFLKERSSKKRENFFQPSFKADYEITPGLKAGFRSALSIGNDVADVFYPSHPFLGAAQASKINNNKQNFTGDIHTSYHREFGRHTLDALAVYEYNDFINDGFSVNAFGFLIEELQTNNLGAADYTSPNNISSFKNEVTLSSFLGRIVYNYEDRFILTANFRRDGSSKFGPNHRWANFPSAAIAWRLSKESFLRNAQWLNLKLRVSYGLTGNQENIPPYPYQQLYGPVGQYAQNGDPKQAYGLTQQSNPDLKWEVRKSFNAGLDFSLFDDRVFGSVDVFNDKTNDLLYLLNLPQPPYPGPVYANTADAVNNGVELALGAAIIRSNQFSWTLRGNIATIRNYISDVHFNYQGLDLGISQQLYGYANGRGLSNAYVTTLTPGHPAGVFWLPQLAGVDSQGRELFNNYDENGKLSGTSNNYSDKDRSYFDPTPDFNWGLTNNFVYKKFDLTVFFRGVHGGKIFANSLLSIGSQVNLPDGNVAVEALSNNFSEQPRPSDYWLRDGTYLRLDNVTLGYTFQKLKGIRNLRLYAVAKNLFVITSYGGIDPEISTDGSQRYIDFGYYPKTRGFTFGIDVTF